MILSRLKEIARQALGWPVRKAVITVPAYFSDTQRQATREAGEIADLPRVDFFHWLLADVPVSARALAEGAFSSGFMPRGKPGPAVTVPGFESARQGVNDFTGWFAGNPALAGDYFGYDGPYPPWNDSLVHHYVFTLYALKVDKLAADPGSTAAMVGFMLNANAIEKTSFTVYYGR